MDFSPDMLNVLAQGFLIGGLAGTFCALAQDTFKEPEARCRLEPAPENYQAAHEFFRLFEDLNHPKLPQHPTKGDQWKIYFKEALRNADAMVGLQKQLENKEIQATLDHKTKVVRYARVICESLRKMEAFFQHSPAFQDHVHKYLNAITSQLLQRRHYIFDLIHRSLV